MNLKKCYIENFGKLHNYTKEFKEGLNIIKEDNGYGKTTFAVFIKSMFFGLDTSIKVKTENSDRKKYKPWQGGNYGGYIEFEINGKEYRIERFFGNKVAEDSFKLYDLATNLESNDYTENIGEEIFKINKSGYERSTYIPQGQIQIEMEDSINAKLGNVLESDNDLNTSDEAIKKISETMKIYKKTGNKGLLNEKKEKLNELERKIENSKSDIANLEIREKLLDEINKKIKQNEETKKQKQELLAKKIEQGRKQAKQETYNNILTKLYENQEKYNNLISFFKEGIPENYTLDDLIAKSIEIEKSKVEVENKNLSEEEQENLQKLRTKFKNTTEKDFERKNINIAKILMIIGVIIIILGMVPIIFNIQKIVGGIIAVVGLAISIISIIIGKNREIQDKELANLKMQFELYNDLNNRKMNQENIKQKTLEEIKNLENEIQNFLLKYFNKIDRNFNDLIQEIKLKKTELSLVEKELENSKKLKEEYEKQNNIEELKIEEENLNDIKENELTKEIDILNNDLDKLNDEKNQNKNLIEVLENKIDENDFIENDIENLKEEIEGIEHKYLILEKTKDLLSVAKETFSSDYLKDMVDGFEHYLNLIDNNTDTNIDINLNVKIDVNGSKKEIKYFSVGYKDLIYICIRFSLIKALFKKEQPFIILDDPFVNLDDEKTRQAIKMVEQFSKEYQIIYLVCNNSRI